MQPSTGALVAYFLFEENISAIQAIAVLMSCGGLVIYVQSKDAQKPKEE
jgi:drug/metabolite transporter (DMT)-like permease